MELKKSDIANLEKRRTLFFMIGLVIALVSVLTALEWKTKPKSDATVSPNNVEVPVEQKTTPIIPHLPAEQPTKVPPPQSDVLKIVNNKAKVDDKVIIPSEATEDLKIQPIPLIDLKSYKVQSEVGALNEKVYMKVEEMPRFQGDDANVFREWIKSHTRYPQIAIENGISGRVIVQFSVNYNGEVVDVVVVRSVDPVLDKEAVRVIKSSPKWTPGRQRGNPVKVQFNFPVYFELQQSN